MEANGNQVLGSGEILFDRFEEGQTEGSGFFRYLGNTPSFSFNQAEESLEHFDADHGLRQKDRSVSISSDMGGGFTCDDISAENLALWFLGDVLQTTVGAASNNTDSWTDVPLGSKLQLGVDPDILPQGVGNVNTVVVKDGADTIAASGNWSVDLATGIVTIFHDAVDIEDGDNDISITYNQGATTFAQIISKNKAIYGSLKFVSHNAVGKKRDAFCPYVKLAPDGDYNLKGDDWQEMSFNLEILKKDANTERVYFNTRD